MLGLLFVLLGTSAHAGEPALTVTIEGKDQYVPWDERHIGQLSLVVHFRVDSDQTANVEVECNFRVPKKRDEHEPYLAGLAGQSCCGRACSSKRQDKGGCSCSHGLSLFVPIPDDPAASHRGRHHSRQ